MKRLIVTIALLLIAAAANYGFSRPEAKQSRMPLSEFPNVIGDWQSARDHLIDDSAMAVLLVDDYIMRTYVNSKGEAVGLYIGYFETQREGKQVHSPRQCLPGAGWGIVEHRVYPLELKGHNPSEVPINYNLMGKGDERDLFLWWYQGRGRIYANEYLNKLYLIWDAITMRRTDGALVRVNMHVKDDVDKTLEAEKEFVNRLAALLADYIPE
jgi:EpsI family protein